MLLQVNIPRFFLVAFVAIIFCSCSTPRDEKTSKDSLAQESKWHAPDSTALPQDERGAMIAYGRELIAHTAKYLGPKGSVMHVSNGMNCQNCHLNAGTKYFGNNYSAVAATYPKFRPRSGTIESIEKRVNDCIERSLNGQQLALDSREMKSIIAYISWVGSDVKKDVAPEGSGLVKVPPMKRAADPALGKKIYASQCGRCHGKNGEGVKLPDSAQWVYPPLWGEQSYNTGAGLYRLSRFAGYVKANMPYGTSYDKPVLTDEEAWDVAAYVNSMPRPKKEFKGDWPDIKTKPFDHPFGPYADSLSETQHKFGPWPKTK